MIKILILMLIAYLVASIPNALWIGKVFKGLDVRNFGSGNVGATNASRVLGYKLGILVLILDVLKSAVFVYIGKVLKFDDFSLVLVALSAILGHSYSIYLKFKGGKAVATSLGVFIVLVPKSILLLIIVFFIVVFITQYVSVASMITAVFLPFFIYIIYDNIIYTCFGFLIGILVVYKHKSNIINLMNGKEDKYFDKTEKIK